MRMPLPCTRRLRHQVLTAGQPLMATAWSQCYSRLRHTLWNRANRLGTWRRAVPVGGQKNPSPEGVVVWVLQWSHTPLSTLLWALSSHHRKLSCRWTAMTWLRKGQRSTVRIVRVVRQALMRDFRDGAVSPTSISPYRTTYRRLYMRLSIFQWREGVLLRCVAFFCCTTPSPSIIVSPHSRNRPEQRMTWLRLLPSTLAVFTASRTPTDLTPVNEYIRHAGHSTYDQWTPIRRAALPIFGIFQTNCPPVLYLHLFS